MLHKEIPFLRLSLPLCTGIISGLFVKPDDLFLLLAGIVIISGIAAGIMLSKFNRGLIFGFSITAGLFMCGLLLYSNEKESLSALKSEKTVFCGTVSDYPSVKANSYMFTLRLNSRISEGVQEQVKGSIIIYSRKDSSVTSFIPGDIIIINCTPSPITNRGNPYEFDYKFYMENNGIKYYAFSSGRDIIAHSAPLNRKLVSKALIIRERIIGMYRSRGITGERLALVSAITLGQKNMLDPEQKQNFIRAGVMHIMAVSGLHTVVLSLFLFNLLFFLKGKFNVLRVLITLVILWMFAFVTGLTPSVLRATLMFTFIQSGSLLQRRVNGINSVLASAFVLILIRPSVIFDAGFLLSYSAVIFIISFYQDIYQLPGFRNHLVKFIWQSAVITLVAQAGTLPLTIMLFNRFPTYFMLTNIVIVPLSSVLVVLGCIIPLLYPVQFISEFLASILSRLTGLTEILTAKASSLPLSNIENIGMTRLECILLAATIFLFCFYFLKKRTISVIYPLSVLLLLVAVSTVKAISVRTSNNLIVYNIPGATTVGIRTGKILNVYSDTTLKRPEVLKHCSSLGLEIKMHSLNDSDLHLKAGDEHIVICNSLDQHILDSGPGVVILTGLKPAIGKSLEFSRASGTKLIISEASSVYRIPQLKNRTRSDTIHLVKKWGTYITAI